MYIPSICFILYIAYCYGLATYELFPGFATNYTDFDNSPEISAVTQNATKNVTQYAPQNATQNASEATTQNENLTESNNRLDNITPISIETPTIKPAIFDCPEEEHPLNIGPYEVPTEKDLMLMIKKMLIKMLQRYNMNAFYLLKDIKQATRATEVIAKKCQGNKDLYKKCVKNVSLQCQSITKNLVSALEKQRGDVTAFTEKNICNMALMETDPLELVKVLAMEEASLRFALPGFLRLLNKCFVYCSSSYKQGSVKKPLRHLTDQDLVIQHFLTRKNYIQLIKGL